MLGLLFHAWEHRLASVSKDRIVRPFEWGTEWMADNGHHTGDDVARAGTYVREILADTGGWFAAAESDAFELAPGPDTASRFVRFPTPRPTPHPVNNTVLARYFPGRAAGCGRVKRAVLVLPQWNSDREGHVGLCRLFAHVGISALRLTLPYHDERMPPELTRADYIVSANVLRTLEVCRQAVLDARRAIQWLARQGYERIGIMGTSLGSCLAMLTACHEPLVKAQALNHISPYFADVVWRGLSTRHVRAGLDGHVSLEELRRLWLPISPQHYLEKLVGTDTRTLLVYARYDLTFPVDLSRRLVKSFRRHRIPHQVAVLPCGHYSTGSTPFKYMDGAVLTRFLDKAL
jgi:Alpha/beta hydrolase domain containing 18